MNTKADTDPKARIQTAEVGMTDKECLQASAQMQNENVSGLHYIVGVELYEKEDTSHGPNIK